MENAQLKALIDLLDDPDDLVFKSVSQELRDKGEDAIPYLEKAWEETFNETLQERIEDVIQQIQFRAVKTQLQRWLNEGADNLLEGCYILTRFQYPDLKYESLVDEVEKIRQDVWLEINNNLTALEKVKIINHIIFEVHKFAGNTSNFYSPQNCYLNQVFETHRGNPISLSVVYLLVAQRLGVPIYGVNLPKNFLLAYVDEWFMQEDQQVLFYINPFNRGVILGKREIDYFIKQQKLRPHESFYEPCGHEDIIKRLILNLILAYENLGHQDKILRLQELINLFR